MYKSFGVLKYLFMGMSLACVAYLVTAAADARELTPLLGIDPVQLMFWANVLQGLLSPMLVVLLLLVGNNRAIMGSYRLGRFTNLGLILIAVIMAGAALLLFYGLLFGRGNKQLRLYSNLPLHVRRILPGSTGYLAAEHSVQRNMVASEAPTATV